MVVKRNVEKRNGRVVRKPSLSELFSRGEWRQMIQDAYPALPEDAGLDEAIAWAERGRWLLEKAINAGRQER